MRRLFTNFAHGAPGVGLLLMRLGAGSLLLAHGIVVLHSAPAPGAVVYAVFDLLVGVLIVAGLWTPVVGALIAIDAAWNAFYNPGGTGLFVLLGALGAGLALVGPGAWSVDARLFGLKRIRIPNAQRNGE
jgi:putative oxidoreductase